MIIDVEFETDPLQEYVDSLEGGKADAARLLTCADGEERLEQAFESLQQRGIGLDISGLPVFTDNSSGAQRLQLEKQMETVEQLLQQFGQDDPLGMYLQELAAIPACGDEELLAQTLLEGDANAAELLMNLSLYRVVELALEYTGHGVLLMDLVQEGSMGLWTAIGSYQGGSFPAFRDQQVRFAMEKAVVLQAQAAGLGQKMRQAVEDYRMTDERLLVELGRNPTPEEIAEALHLEAGEAAAVASMLDAARDMQRARPRQEEQEQSQEENQAVEDTAYFQQRQRILDMLSGLSEQEARLLSLRYGLEGGKPMTAAEAGLKLGLTAQQTVELETKALEKLRKQ